MAYTINELNGTTNSANALKMGRFYAQKTDRQADHRMALDSSHSNDNPIAGDNSRMGRRHNPFPMGGLPWIAKLRFC